MKKIIYTMLIIFGLLLPIKIFAAPNPDDYVTMNLEEALNQENIDIQFKEYKETDDQVTIYLFRGNGCNYSRGFLTYLNSIADSNKKFKVVSFEVWNDADNNNLMEEVASFLNQSIKGIPFIIIGNQVFQGYGEDYNESIEQAINTEYAKSAKDRYDVFDEMKKAEKVESSKYTNIIIWNGVIVALAMLIIIVFINYQNNKIHDRIDAIYLKLGIEIEDEDIKKSLINIEKIDNEDEEKTKKEDNKTSKKDNKAIEKQDKKTNKSKK